MYFKMFIWNCKNFLWVYMENKKGVVLTPSLAYLDL
jgi:hypothetical protein